MRSNNNQERYYKPNDNKKRPKKESKPYEKFDDKRGDYQKPNEKDLIKENLKKELLAEAQLFKQRMGLYQEQKIQEPFKDKFYYILSNKFLNEWKAYVSYNEAINNKPLSAIFGKDKPFKINDDLVYENPKEYATYPDKDSHLCVILKRGLEQDKDFIIVNEDVWTVLKPKYPYIEIKREVIVGEDEQKTLEIYPKIINLAYIWPDHLRKIESNKNENLFTRKLQVSSKMQFKDFKLILTRSVNRLGILKTGIDSKSMRLWLLDQNLSWNDLHQYLHEACKKSKTYDYQIEMKGILVNLDSVALVETLKSDDLFVVEILELMKNWVFFSDQVKQTQKCPFCQNYGILDYECGCHKMAYCSQLCKFKDRKHHAKVCNMAFDSEDEEKFFVPSLKPIDGICGLENLGNTCYMNAAIQGLGNIQELTEYFLKDRYLDDINLVNPLGTKGILAKKYAYVLKNLWLGDDKTHAPNSFKSAISKFQPIFAGQNQHDSNELLAYLLDGLHEDLNLVQVKPLTNNVEADNRPDYEVAKESWEIFLKRNQSIIVDLLYGQLKSTLQCPKCARISTTFDSFSICSLPIPNKSMFEIYYISSDTTMNPYKLNIRFFEKRDDFIRIRSEIASLLKKVEDQIGFAVYDGNKMQYISDLTTQISSITSKFTKIYFIAYELPTENKLDIQLNDKSARGQSQNILHTDFQFTGTISGQKRKVSLPRPIFIDKNMTNEQIHHVIYSKLRNLIESTEHQTWEQENVQSAYLKIYKNPNKPKPYDLLIGWKGSIDGQIVDELVGFKYSEDVFSVCYPQVKNDNLKVYFEVYWKHLPRNLSFDQLRGIKRMENNQEEDEEIIDIGNCFKLFTDTEELDETNMWYCRHCKDHQKATKKMDLYKLPKILIVHLKRFKTSYITAKWSRIETKIDDLVVYPIENLDLTDYVLNPDFPNDYFNKKKEDEIIMMDNNSQYVENKKVLYDLIGVINHFGNLNSGHYTTFARNFKDNIWYNFDDEKVTKIENLNELVTDSAYLLIYKRKCMNK